MEKVIGVIEKKIRESSVEDLGNKFNTFRHLVANLQQDKEYITSLLDGELDILCLKAKEMLKIFEEKEMQRIKLCLQDFFEKNPDTRRTALRNEMQKIIKREIAKGFDVLRNDTERVISKNIQETVNHFLRRSHNIIYEFKTAVEILFEVPIDQFEYSMDLLKNSSFYCIVQEHTATSDNEFKFILRAFLSQSIRRKLVLYEMIAGMTSDVSRNCDRVLCDFTSGICTTIEYYSRQLKDLGNNLVAQIEQAMQKGQERRRVDHASIQMGLAISANRAKTPKEYKESRTNVECY